MMRKRKAAMSRRKFRRIREALSLSQSEFARRMSMSPSTVSRMEAGLTPIGAGHLAAMLAIPEFRAGLLRTQRG